MKRPCFVCLFLCLTTTFAVRPAQAQTETVLYNFTGGSDGGDPAKGVTFDGAGNLYGTTHFGGLGCPGNQYGCGVVYEISPNGSGGWNETVLYSFTGGADGGDPSAALVLDAQGNLYGTTCYGGDFACNVYSGCGTVFKLDTTGKETVLYSFTGGTDGADPMAGLVQDAQGNLYGTTARGGGHGDGKGTVFKLDTTGKETVLHSMGGKDGHCPSELVLDAQGNLYGTNSRGGVGGRGTVFMLDTTGNFTVLHRFGSFPDGAHPSAGLVLDAQGNLYGTTSAGGADSWGTVFKVDKKGNETVLHSFLGKRGKLYADGARPYAPLVLDAQGNLYGTTYVGGADRCGTVFKLDTTGKETVLHSFTWTGGDGADPYAGLVLDAQGNLYGTTQSGGADNNGTVFKLTP